MPPALAAASLAQLAGYRQTAGRIRCALTHSVNVPLYVAPL